jgi:hypothetical protein
MATDREDDARHKAKMEKRKALQDAEVAGKTVEKGLLIVHKARGRGNRRRRLASSCARWDAVFASASCNSGKAPGTRASAKQ